MFLVLIEKFDQKANFHPRLVWIRPYKSRIGPKQGENMVFKSREWHYIVSIYKYYNLTLFLVLFGSLTKSQILSPDWPYLRIITAE